MIRGRVKSWNASHGWGFIQSDDGEDYFIHTSKVRMGQIISNNCQVKFDVFQGQRGPEAVDVTLY